MNGGDPGRDGDRGRRRWRPRWRCSYHVNSSTVMLSFINPYTRCKIILPKPQRAILVHNVVSCWQLVEVDILGGGGCTPQGVHLENLANNVETNIGGTYYMLIRFWIFLRKIMGILEWQRWIIIKIGVWVCGEIMNFLKSSISFHEWVANHWNYVQYRLREDGWQRLSSQRLSLLSLFPWVSKFSLCYG